MLFMSKILRALKQHLIFKTSTLWCRELKKQHYYSLKNVYILKEKSKSDFFYNVAIFQTISILRVHIHLKKLGPNGTGTNSSPGPVLEESMTKSVKKIPKTEILFYRYLMHTKFIFGSKSVF